MGYSTIDMAMFVPPALAVQVRNWLVSNYDNAIEPIPIIRTTDPDSASVRYWGVQMRVTPEMFSAIKRLTDNPAFSDIVLRGGFTGPNKLRRKIRREMVERGFRVKP